MHFIDTGQNHLNTDANAMRSLLDNTANSPGVTDAACMDAGANGNNGGHTG